MPSNDEDDDKEEDDDEEDEGRGIAYCVYTSKNMGKVILLLIDTVDDDEDEGNFVDSRDTSGGGTLSFINSSIA